MPLEFVDRALRQKTAELLLVLARAADLSVTALRRILLLRGRGQAGINDVEKSVIAYRRLKGETAAEILRFYRARGRLS